MQPVIAAVGGGIAAEVLAVLGIAALVALVLTYIRVGMRKNTIAIYRDDNEALRGRVQTLEADNDRLKIRVSALEDSNATMRELLTGAKAVQDTLARLLDGIDQKLDLLVTRAS